MEKLLEGRITIPGNGAWGPILLGARKKEIGT